MEDDLDKLAQITKAKNDDDDEEEERRARLRLKLDLTGGCGGNCGLHSDPFFLKVRLKTHKKGRDAKEWD